MKESINLFNTPFSLLDQLRGSRKSGFINKWNISGWYAQTSKSAALDKKAHSVKPQKWHTIIYFVLGFSALIAVLGMIGIVYLIRAKRRLDSGGCLRC